MLNTIRPRESSAKLEHVLLNASSAAAGLILRHPQLFWRRPARGEPDPRFTFVKEQLCITNRETR
jgi:hypothetical protein